jgi:hypothetical protein
MSTEHKAVVDQATGEIYVDPKTDCPHIGQHVGPTITAEVISKAFEEGSCHGCADKSENWVCLHCGQVRSSPCSYFGFSNLVSFPLVGHFCASTNMYRVVSLLLHLGLEGVISWFGPLN